MLHGSSFDQLVRVPSKIRKLQTQVQQHHTRAMINERGIELPALLDLFEKYVRDQVVEAGGDADRDRIALIGYNSQVFDARWLFVACKRALRAFPRSWALSVDLLAFIGKGTRQGKRLVISMSDGKAIKEVSAVNLKSGFSQGEVFKFVFGDVMENARNGLGDVRGLARFCNETNMLRKCLRAGLDGNGVQRMQEIAKKLGQLKSFTFHPETTRITSDEDVSDVFFGDEDDEDEDDCAEDDGKGWVEVSKEDLSRTGTMPVHTYDEKALGGRTAVNLMRRIEIDQLADGKREKVAAKKTRAGSARFVPPPATGPSGRRSSQGGLPMSRFKKGSNAFRLSFPSFLNF
jgi:hypothetical protein